VVDQSKAGNEPLRRLTLHPSQHQRYGNPGSETAITAS
jgi:hypothetical protein